MATEKRRATQAFTEEEERAIRRIAEAAASAAVAVKRNELLRDLSAFELSGALVMDQAGAVAVRTVTGPVGLEDFMRLHFGSGQRIKLTVRLYDG